MLVISVDNTQSINPMFFIIWGTSPSEVILRYEAFLGMVVDTAQMICQYRFLENRKACVLTNSNIMTASQFVCRACDEFLLEFLENKELTSKFSILWNDMSGSGGSAQTQIIGDPCTNDAEPWNAISNCVFLFFLGEHFSFLQAKTIKHRTTFKLSRKKGRKF